MPLETHINGRKRTLKTREALMSSWEEFPVDFDPHTLEINIHPVMYK